jgi:PAS domain S-box-containing protein
MKEISFYIRKITGIASVLAAIFAIAAGTAALCGWVFDSDLLKMAALGNHYILPNIALGLSLAGLAFILMRLNSGKALFVVKVISVVILLTGLISLYECFNDERVLLDFVFARQVTAAGMQNLSLFADLLLVCLGLLILIQSTLRFYNLFVIHLIAVLIFSVGFIGFISEVFNLAEITESRHFLDVADLVWLNFMLLPAAFFIHNLFARDVKFSVEHQLLMGLTFLSVITVFIAANSGERVRNIRRINAMIKSTMRIKESLRVVQGLILDIQSGVRGYVISGDTVFLENYNAALNELPGALRKIDSLVVDIPEQKQKLFVLKRLTANRVAEAETLAVRRKYSSAEVTGNNFDVLTGKKITDSIRIVVATMIDAENKMLEDQNGLEIDRALKVQSVIIANLVIQIILIFQLFRTVVSNLRSRRKSIDEIKRINESLEEKIQKRTALLEASENKYKFLFENNPMPMLIFDVRTLAIFEVNDAATRLYGYSGEEFLSMILTDLRPPDDVTELIRQLEKESPAYTEGQAIKHRKKNGETIYVELYDHSLTLKGRRARFVLINDISIKLTAAEEIRKVNETLEQKVAARTSELEAANRAKSDFLANMSHEIRTPMNAILGYSELLGSMISEKNQIDYLSSIKSSGRLLLTLINDILDISKVEAGKFDLEFEYTDTKSFFSEFEKIFAFKVSEKGLKFVTEISANLPPYLYIDGPRVRQIILNLTGNAVKFTEKGGVVLRVYPEIRHEGNGESRPSGDHICLIIEVEDSGIGIPEEYQASVFESFIQVKSRTSQSGTGLGLAISRKLVSLMNGTIKLNSSPGKGSKFMVRIPDVPCRLNFEQVLNEKPLNPSLIRFEKGLILVADDVIQNRTLIADILRGSPVRMMEADNGADALRLISEFKPDIVISDIRMPGLDGFELLDRIKSDPAISRIPVVAYSASVMKEQREKIMSSDFSGLLVKPVRIADLYQILMKFLPFKSINSAGTAVEEPDAQTGDITNLPLLLSTLKGNYLERRKAFLTRQPVSEVRGFGRSLTELGQLHNCMVIKNYGADIERAASEFNVERMLLLLGQYDEKILLVEAIPK